MGRALRFLVSAVGALVAAACHGTQCVGNEGGDTVDMLQAHLTQRSKPSIDTEMDLEDQRLCELRNRTWPTRVLCPASNQLNLDLRTLGSNVVSTDGQTAAKMEPMEPGVTFAKMFEVLPSNYSFMELVTQLESWVILFMVVGVLRPALGRMSPSSRSRWSRKMESSGAC